MGDVFDAILLLALPASGKSEVRRYLEALSDEERRDLFHMGPLVQLDDFPYVHIMRRIDEISSGAGLGRVFFEAADGSFADPIEWGALTALLDEDCDDLEGLRRRAPQDPIRWLLDRFDRARRAVGGAPVGESIGASLADLLSEGLEGEVRGLIDGWNRALPDSLDGRTAVIELARGGPEGSRGPLEAPMGYGYSLSVFSDAVLERAAVLYIWVTPEISRRKNRERADPDDPGSILHHGVPERVMRRDYGRDDMDHLLEASGEPDAIRIRGRLVPAVRLDNREDMTTLLRAPREEWGLGDERRLRKAVRGATDRLWKSHGAHRR